MQNGHIAAEGALQDVLQRTDLPVLGGEEAGAVLEGRASGYDSEFDLTKVAFSGGEFWISGRHEAGSALRLRIRASDVSLSRDRPATSTIMNILPATIVSIEFDSEASELVRLDLGGERLLARITRRSRTELGVEAGDGVMALIKSVAVKNAPMANRS